MASKKLAQNKPWRVKKKNEDKLVLERKGYTVIQRKFIDFSSLGSEIFCARLFFATFFNLKKFVLHISFHMY